MQENHDALRAAQQYAKERGEISSQYGDIYKEAQAVEVLQRAIVRPELRKRADETEYYAPLFVNAQQMRESCSEDELRVLLNVYHETKAHFTTLEGLGERTAEEWIERLSDPLDGLTNLSQLDSLHWPAAISLLAKTARDLCHRLGVPLSTSPDISGSGQTSSTPDTGSYSGQAYASFTGPGSEPITGEKLPNE